MRPARWRWPLRFARRELAAGELTVLGLALTVAVLAIACVGLFSDRLDRALTREATQLLAADLVINADTPLPAGFVRQAAALGLSTAQSASFPSMAGAGEQVTLSAAKAVSDRYPLRGELEVRLVDGRVVHGALHPAPGTAWVDERLLSKLKIKLGDSIRLGNRQLQLAGELLREPDATLDLYQFIPRLLFNQADLAATGLVQEGSRVRWRLLVAGTASQVNAFQQWAAAHLPRGARIENVEDARPEVRVALERTRRFLGVAAMMTVALAAAAVALAVRRYLMRHWQSVAVLRCLGLTGREVGALFSGLFLLLGLAAGIVGTLAGYGLQAGLLNWLLPEFAARLPPAGWQAWLLGPAAALVLLAGLALPPLWTVRHVPPAAVLRHELPPAQPGWLAPLAAVFALLALSVWLTADRTATLWLLGGFAGFLLLAGLLALALLGLLRALGPGAKLSWRYGMANLGRRPWLASIQLVALAVGLMALLALTMVRADLIGTWRRSVPPDAPNRFVLNVQPGQLAELRQTFAEAGQPVPEFAPMVRARLLAINGKPLRPAAYRDEQARRLAEREFNLSWRDTLPSDNRVAAGQWWSGAHASPQFSVEQGLADKLGIRLGDTLRFDLAGTTYQARVSSLRAVRWDSFHVNFFVLAPSGWFGEQPASYIASFRLAPGQEAFATQLSERFPNLTVIDVEAILDQVRSMIDRLALSTEAMFSLALAAGVLVLWAALAATRDERLFDVALMRALGASRRQLAAMLYAELAWLGGMAGLLAGGGALALERIVALHLLNLPLAWNWQLPLAGMAVGVLVVTVAGWPLLRRVTRTPPMATLQAL